MWVCGVKFAKKKHYVTLEWPLCVCGIIIVYGCTVYVYKCLYVCKCVYVHTSTRVCVIIMTSTVVYD